MVHGIYSMEHGAWCMVHGVYSIEQGERECGRGKVKSKKEKVDLQA